MRVLFVLLTCFTFLHRSVSAQQVIVGAEHTVDYLPLLQEKRVGLVINQTSVIGNTHLVDSLKNSSVKLVTIFAPEHGFRGTADAGAHIKNSKDEKSGLPIVSLYGSKHTPDSADLNNIDIIIFDIQDVGCRFYTFISTLHYVMEACAKNKVQLIVLDRPNPNGHYVDGPVLEEKFKSFVGVDKIPIFHGLTIGEYAQMVKGEKWIADSDSLNMMIIKCSNYNHKTAYKLPVKPSPNLPNAKAIELYPSLCLFEGTNISVGRGTNFPFQIIGSPYFDSTKTKFSFVPKSKAGATNPFMLNKKCYGFDLRKKNPKGLNLSYVMSMYQGFADKSKFFLTNGFFDKLAGTDKLRLQIIKGVSEHEIRKSWEADLEQYKIMRKKYLLYED
jgi:uncharacterized protein YbbC (DUF1343 family)